MSDALVNFLDCFDAYEQARQELRALPEAVDAGDHRQHLERCILLWQRAVEARGELTEASA